MADSDVLRSLADLRAAAHPSLAATFAAIEEEYRQRRWHQLTLLTVELFRNAESTPIRHSTYTAFVTSWEKHADQRIMADIAYCVSETLRDNTPQTAEDLLVSAVDKITEPSASVAAMLYLARCKLTRNMVSDAKKIVAECVERMSKLPAPEMNLHGLYYYVLSQLDLRANDYSAFYNSALLFLACGHQSTFPFSDTREIAEYLCVAALLGESVLSFNRLFSQKVPDYLSGTPKKWLADLVLVFNNGDFAMFKALEPQWSTHPVLGMSPDKLITKMRMMAFSLFVFRKPPHSRVIPFVEIAAETALQPADIERFLIKTMSLGLLRGSIDNVSSTVDIKWIQPRAIGMADLDTLRAHIEELGARIRNTADLLSARIAAIEA